MDAEIKAFLIEELKGDMESLTRALRWAEIHAQQLGLTELNGKLTKMSEDLKSMLDEVGSFSNPYKA